jgi:predicted metallo-beta-lactamase superfamily hydrolase
MIHGYKLPPQELTSSRVASLERSLEELTQLRYNTISKYHYDQLTEAINSIKRALQGENL